MKHTLWKLGLLLAIALTGRLGAGVLLQWRLGGQFCLGDSESYWQLGSAIARAAPYEYGPLHARVFRTPGYPVLLAPVIYFFGQGKAGVAMARAEAALFGTLAVALVWWLGRRLFDERAAWIAAVLATFYPGAVALSLLVLSEAPFCPLMLLQLVLWTVAWESSRPGRRAVASLGAGLAGGAAALMRPEWLLFTPLAAVASMVSCRLSVASCRLSVGGDGQRTTDKGQRTFIIRHSSAVACWLLLGLVLAMLPWWVRNARLTHHFVPTTLQVGASLYDGLNPHANGASDMEDFVRRFVAQQRAADANADAANNRQDAGSTTGNGPNARVAADVEFERRLDRRMRDAAIDWAWANPGRALALAAVKFARMWNVWPNEPRLSASWFVRLAVFFTYTPLLIFAIIGAWRTVGHGWPYILCWLPAVYLTMLHVVFVSSIRYREPAMLALLALAAGELTRWRKS